ECEILVDFGVNRVIAPRGGVRPRRDELFGRVPVREQRSPPAQELGAMAEDRRALAPVLLCGEQKGEFRPRPGTTGVDDVLEDERTWKAWVHRGAGEARDDRERAVVGMEIVRVGCDEERGAGTLHRPTEDAEEIVPAPHEEIGEPLIGEGEERRAARGYA